MTGIGAEILSLIAARRSRRPARDLAALAQLFRRLGACASAEALETEDRIWGMWMHHPHRGAAGALDAATRDIAARRYDIAETRLTALLRSAPLYAEAWHKRAALYYLLGRDDECLRDIRRTLELEPFRRDAAFRRDPAGRWRGRRGALRVRRGALAPSPSASGARRSR